MFIHREWLYDHSRLHKRIYYILTGECPSAYCLPLYGGVPLTRNLEHTRE
ncbi:MAG: hypothetical protein HC787_03330 [Nostocaceae cyanobacterium CSU_2_110]|nr:hypothetical protein [Nostocaceae cyanobacterium CSU_2_110]